MPKRRSKHDEREDAPKPFHSYLLLGLVVLVVIAGAYMNRDAITAFVVNTFTPAAAGTSIISEPVALALPEPDCSSSCGSACWLTDAHNEIGLAGCDGSCLSVVDVANNEKCCRNADCPKDELCQDGVCG